LLRWNIYLDIPSLLTIKIKVPSYLKKYIIALIINKAELNVFELKHVYVISLIKKVNNFVKIIITKFQYFC